MCNEVDPTIRIHEQTHSNMQRPACSDVLECDEQSLQRSRTITITQVCMGYIHIYNVTDTLTRSHRHAHAVCYHAYITMLMRVLMYVRMRVCAGNSKLPANEAGFRLASYSHFTIASHAQSQERYAAVDTYLPASHTCYFMVMHRNHPHTAFMLYNRSSCVSV